MAMSEVVVGFPADRVVSTPVTVPSAPTFDPTPSTSGLSTPTFHGSTPRGWEEDPSVEAAAAAAALDQANAQPAAPDGSDVTRPEVRIVVDAADAAQYHENSAFEMDESRDYHVAPPTYDEVINSTRYPIVRSTTRTLQRSGWKLDFIDFTPHLSPNSDRMVGDFKSLLRRANAWLKSNAEVEVKTCESVTWMATNQSHINETDVVQRAKSLSASLKTKYLRGIRLWFVPASVPRTEDVTINMEDFAPNDNDETITTLLKKVNRTLQDHPLPGSILNVETVYARTKPGKIYLSSTFWSEAPSKPRQYAFFLRVFFIVGTPERGEIDVKDFVPAQMSDSYENFSDVMEKGTRWAYDQTEITVKNMQAVFVKRKGTPDASHGRCFYTEHAMKAECRITYFYQVLRIYYIKKPLQLLHVHIPLQVTKKTFAPAMLPPTADERETRFESFTKTVERVSSWLDSTGAGVFCVETVPVRMHTGTQQRQGPEATLVWSQPEPGVKVEDWLLFVRVYVKGEYRELRMQHALSMPPIDWYRRPRHEPIRRPARRKRNCFVFCLVFLFIMTASFVVVYIVYNFIL